MIKLLSFEDHAKEALRSQLPVYQTDLNYSLDMKKFNEKVAGFEKRLWDYKDHIDKITDDEKRAVVEKYKQMLVQAFEFAVKKG